MARDQMQEVILVEVADLDRDDVVRASGADGEADGGAQTRDRVVRGLRRGWPLVAGLLVLLVAVGAAAAVRTRDRAARLAALPGVLAPLDPSLRELWREPMRGWGQLAAIGGDVVLFGRDDQGAAAIVSLDGTTGEHRWEVPLPEVTATGDVWCAALDDAGGDRAAHLVCRLVSTSVIDAQDGSYRPDGAARLVVLDSRTGQRVAERTMDSPDVSVEPLGRDLIITEVLADGRAEVTREGAVTGEVLWTFRSAEPLRKPSGGPLWFFPVVQHGVIVANGPVTWAFALDGTVLGEWHLQGGDWAVRGGWGLDVSVLPDGRFAVGESGGVGLSDDQYGTVSTTDARDGYPIPGPVLKPVVDDGSAADILFCTPTGSGGLVAMDLATGARLWRFASIPWGSALVLDGRLIAVVDRALVAFGARSGQVLWRADVPMGNHAGQVLTDGHAVLVPMFDPAQGAVLTAFDPADGRARWTRRLPSGTNYLAAADGRLLALTDRDLVALG